MARLQKITVPIICNTTNNTIGTANTPTISGYIRKIKVKSPATVDSSATLTTTIKDDDADSLSGLATGFAGQAAAATVQQAFDTQTAPSPLGIPVAGVLAITATLSATQAAPKTVIATLYVENLIG